MSSWMSWAREALEACTSPDGRRSDAESTPRVQRTQYEGTWVKGSFQGSKGPSKKVLGLRVVL